MIAATRNDNLQIVTYLLDKGADVNVCNIDGQTPLMNAAQFGYTRMAEVLLSHGAEVNTWDANTNTALSDAIGSGHIEVAQLLLKKGATPVPGLEDLIKKSKPQHH